MGKLNEIQEQMTQSYGSNSFTTTIKENTVEFDSLKDKFTFTDPVEVPSINVNGQESVAFTSADRTKLDNLQTPMQIKGRVDSVAELPTEAEIGDTYLVGLSGSETFEEYVCTGFDGSDESAIWESVGTTQAQADWNQNDNTAADYIKNRICYETGLKSTLFSGEIEVVQTQGGNNAWFNIEPMSILHSSGSDNVFYPVQLGSNLYIVPIVNFWQTYYSQHNTFNFFGIYYDSNGDLYGMGYNTMIATTPGVYDLTIYNTLQTCVGTGDFDFTHGSTLEVGKTYDVFASPTGQTNNVTKYTVVAEASDSGVKITFNGVTITYIEGGVHTGNITGGSEWGIYVISPYTKFVNKLDDKFIPDTVARTSQLGGVQFKIAGSPASLQASIDGGSTWKTVTLS